MISPARYQARRRTGRLAHRRSLRLESLEERQLLAVLTVDIALDVVDAADGLTSLREAIVTANSLSGADEIVFDFGHDGHATIQLQLGELQLTEAVTITGAGPELLTIDAQQQSRIFNITAEDGDFTIEGLTLTNGKTAGSNGDGGAIRSMTRDALTVHNSVVKDSVATGSGGGIEGGHVTVESSTISDNTASGNGGGGISGDNVMVRSSTISGNTTPHGGGISGGNVTVHSSTVSGNTAIFSGGGISADNVTVLSTTITGNTTVYGGDRPPRGIRLRVGGGGIYTANEVTILDSILAGNHGTTPDLKRGSISSNLTIEDSLIGDNRGADVGEAPVGLFDANGNLILIGGPVSGVIDPLLGPLADNGGPTFSHALLPGSPAIDTGDPLAMAGSGDVPQFDQRDAPYSRVVGGRIDMGAFEWSAPDHFNDRLIGDSNDDGVFDSLDLLQVLSAGKYKDDIANNATFDDGDWNGDGDFDALDLVFALQAGHYVSSATPLEAVTGLTDGRGESWTARDVERDFEFVGKIAVEP